jgi:alpha-glutamyl/putrescinyl thymine pyrophosphorylase clade 1
MNDGKGPQRRGRRPKAAQAAKPKSPQLDLSIKPQPSAPTIVLRHLAPALATEVYDSYWRFAAERQQIFFRRMANTMQPWTADPILATYKFTNAYRASDRVSQYLIRNVIYRKNLPDDPQELIFRILLFKIFNKIETWQMLEQKLGDLTFSSYSFIKYDEILSDAMSRGIRIYSAAYIMPPGGTTFGQKFKHQNHLKLLEMMMKNELPARLADSQSMQLGFELLLSYPTIGDFLAYQYITDINYSPVTDFSEMDFVVPGPGARDGLRKCFVDTGGLTDPELIRLVADRQEKEFERLELEFPSLWGRRLQLIDCQNLFCEVDKYARVAHPEIIGVTGRSRIKQKFSSTESRLDVWYPPKWDINTSIESAKIPNEVRLI